MILKRITVPALGCALVLAVVPFARAGDDDISALEPLVGYWAGSGTVRLKRSEPEREVTCRANYTFTSDEKTKIKAAVTCDGAKAKSQFVAFISSARTGGLRGSWWQSQGDTSGELGGDLAGRVADGVARLSVDAAGKMRGIADISIGARKHSFVVTAIDDASQSLKITFHR